MISTCCTNDFLLALYTGFTRQPSSCVSVHSLAKPSTIHDIHSAIQTMNYIVEWLKMNKPVPLFYMQHEANGEHFTCVSVGVICVQK